MAGEMAEIEGVVIDVEDGLVSSVRQHLAALGDVKPENYTIFRVPARIRERNKDLYEPQMVSIGPYHYGNPAFKAMQMYKWQCLRDFLARRRDICVEDCISRLRKLEPRARRCYFEPVELDGDEFVEMLLLDGCFVIKFLMIWLSDNKKDAVCNTAWSLSFIRDDLFLLDNQIPFFIIESLFALLFPTPASDRCGVSALIGLLVLCITQVFASIKRAFALLFPTPASELCAVSALMDFIGTYIPRQSALRDFVVTYLTYYSALTASLVTCKTPDITWDEREELPVEQRKEIHHLLHVYHLCFVSTKIPNSSTAGNSSVTEWLKLICFVPTQNPNSSTAGNSSVAKWAAGSLLPCFCISEEGEKRAPGTIPCATALKEAGVTFTKKKDKKSKNETNSSGSFLDITFRNGILEIPFFKVDDSTRSRFANLVAFEQSMGSAEGRYMTSYAYFMDCIINTAKDVAILQDSGIIENLLASDEDLAIFFNQLCEGKFLDLKEHYLAPLFKEVRKYCDLKRHKWRAKLMKDYFSNPWAIFSLVAAIAFLIFTFLQTFFTIFPYYHPRNN